MRGKQLHSNNSTAPALRMARPSPPGRSTGAGNAARNVSPTTMTSNGTCQIAAACVECEVFAQAAPMHRCFFAEQEFRLLRQPVDWAAVSAVDGGVDALQ